MNHGIKISLRSLRATLLTSLLFVSGHALAEWQQPAAFGKLSEKEAESLRAEANHDFEIQNHADALAKYLRIHPNYEDDFEINRRIGWLYLYSPQNKWREAIPYLRKAYQANSTDSELLHELARTTAWARLFQESLPLYRELLRRSAPVPEYWLEFARALGWSGKKRGRGGSLQVLSGSIPFRF